MATLKLTCRNLGKGEAWTIHLRDGYHAKVRKFPAAFTGKDENECAVKAKASGWQYDRKSKTALCPACRKDHA